MIESLHQLDFLCASGTLRLLDIGAIVEAEPALSVTQAAERYAPIGAEWSEARAMGGAETALSWTAVRNHASQAELRAFCIRHAATFPSGQTGTLRVTISGGEVWDLEDAVLSSVNPLPLASSGTFETATTYAAAGGRLIPAAPVTLYAGIPWDHILQDWDALTGTWDSL